MYGRYDWLLLTLALIVFGGIVYGIVEWARYKIDCRRQARMDIGQRRAIIDGGEPPGFEVGPPSDDPGRSK